MNSPKISSKPKKKILRLLPKAAQVAVSFQNPPPFSPARDSSKLKSHLQRGFSGPIISKIPAEARIKSAKNYETQEPTSPKVSCMGQIKQKKKMCKKQASLPKGFKPVLQDSHRPEKIGKARSVGPASELKKKKPSTLMKIFNCGGRKSDAVKPPLPQRAPSLSQMRRFASSRDTFANFDWSSSSQVAPEEDDGGDFYSDEGEDNAGIAFSAPMFVAAAPAREGGGLALEPRKEINLWKRRTMAQPKPLQLTIATSR